MKTIPEFTDAEIHNMMDFDKVLALTEAAHRRNKKNNQRIFTSAIIAGLVGAALFMYLQSQQGESNVPVTQQTETSPESTAPANETPAVADDSTALAAKPEEKIEARKEKQIIKHSPEKPSVVDKSDEEKAIVKVDSAKSVFLPAEPVDGYDALYIYFARELRYPEEAVKDSIQGVISVTFVISTAGKPEQVSTDRALGESFDREAIRVIQNMPAWKPAHLDGAPVRSKVSVPITFSVKTTRQK